MTDDEATKKIIESISTLRPLDESLPPPVRPPFTPKVRVAVEKLWLDRVMSLLRECSDDYNHPRFTDRRGTGPRLKSVLDEANDAIKPME